MFYRTKSFLPWQWVFTCSVLDLQDVTVMSMPNFPKLLIRSFHPFHPNWHTISDRTLLFSPRTTSPPETFFFNFPPPLYPMARGRVRQSFGFSILPERLYPDKHRYPFSYTPSSRQDPTIILNTLTIIAPVRNAVSVVDTMQRRFDNVCMP